MPSAARAGNSYFVATSLPRPCPFRFRRRIWHYTQAVIAGVVFRRQAMPKGRLEAFSDGVLAILITIMVLDLRIPRGASDLAALRAVLSPFVAYVLSFLYIGIYWNNHHHLFQASHSVNGKILWANLHLLFWLSLIPAVTAWMGQQPFRLGPAVIYGLVLFMSGVTYIILQRSLVKHHGKDSRLQRAMGYDAKGKLSIALYTLAIALAFVNPRIPYVLYLAVALIWLIPDPRIERSLEKGNSAVA